MADTKTVVSTVTLHVPGPKFKPFEFSDAGFVRAGKYDMIHAKPGTPVILPAAEADKLIERGTASLYEAPEAAAPPVPIEAVTTAAKK